MYRKPLLHLKKSLLFFALFITIGFFKVKAQATGNCNVFGKVSDGLTGEMIDFAGVSMFQQGTDIIFKSISTSNGGNFKFVNIPYGKYTIRISYVGFEKQIIEDVDLSTDHPDFSLGTIRLKKASGELSEVKIVEKKPTLEVTADQITYNVSESLQAEGSTATDILKNVPMVNVDIDGNISIAGKRNTRIFIDGKPSDYMTSNISDLLNVLPSDAIEKIEVMNNPPAKYSADGEGIINIVLKKGYKVGLNGTLSLNAGTLGNYNANAYTAYRSKGFSLTSSYAFGESQNTAGSQTYNQNYLPDTNYHNQEGARRGQNFGQNFRGGINWDIDTTQNIKLTSNFNFNNSDGSSFSDDAYLNETFVQRKLNTQSNNNQNRSVNVVLDGSYTLKLRNGWGQLDASLTYSNNSAGNNRASARHYLDSLGMPVIGKTPLDQTYDVDAANRGFEFKIDYDKPLGKSKSTVDFGVSINSLSNDNNQDVENYNFKTSIYETNKNLTNRFLFNEKIYSAYASLSLRIADKWSFRAGARSELTDMNFDLSTISQQYAIKPYINVFPNLSLSRLFKKYTVGLSYNGRIGRPGSYSLSPQVTTTDSVNFSFGNPNLTPSYTQQIDLSFSVFGQDWAIYPRLGYSTTSSIIERITTQPAGTSIYQSTYDNLGSSQYYTFNLYGNYRLNKKFNLNGGATVGSMVYQSLTNSKLNRSGITFQAKTGIQIDLPKRLAFEGNFNYYTNSSAQGSNKGSLTGSVAMRKVLYKNKIRLRIMAINPFGQTKYSTYTAGDNFNRQNYNIVVNRNFTATISYNFTKVAHSAPTKKGS
ncbi:TonB-dependent receptor [Mucilaginibacter sp. HMF5004]|uniref:TonB-dependent receptor domain-containing protein n=1 Tax=Mucilaginibacter rivuli TaxID=2857527 RepID=UPI001C5DE6C7|nr:TonB-dependent receptor [Mucilaginibacter rivuli]MBW4891886.1 TonB-dependent receptor [Mucilaginibacter rivuli]